VQHLKKILFMATRPSKFFAAASDDDEDDRESQDDRSQDQEGSQKDQQAPTGSGAFFKKFHLDESDDDDAPVKRVVKSVRDKRFEEMESSIEKIQSKTKINDWNSILDEFEKLNKALTKLKLIIQREGVPRPYIRACAELEDFLKKTNEDAELKNKMSKINSKAFNTMKQRLKKNNLQYTQQIEDYRKAPDEPTAEADAEVEHKEKDEDEDEDEPVSETPRKPVSSFFRKDEDEDEEEEEEEERPKPKAAPQRSSWFKSDSASDSDEGDFAQAGKRKGKGKAKGKEGPAAPAPAAPAPASTEPRPAPAVPTPDQLPAAPAKVISWTDEYFEKRLAEIAAGRGKRATNPLEQIAALEELLSHAPSPVKRIEVLIHIISAQFDTSAGTHMPVAIWKSCQQNIVQLVATFEEHYPAVQLKELDESEQGAETSLPIAPSDGVQRIQVGLFPSLVRLDNELTRILQSVDPHTQEYVARLQDESLLLDACERVQNYYVRLGHRMLLARVSALRMEHLYYKKALSPPDILQVLASPVYRWGDERTKSRVTLCQVYHNALVDEYYTARDMLLMSHLVDTVPLLAQQAAVAATPSEADISLQILYNRTLVQLGMAAFRKGLIAEAHSALADICNNRLKELLAQGIAPRVFERTAEQERAERRRILPYHMHINTDLLECMHFVSAVLLEVPNMAAQPLPDSKKKYISKALRRRLDEADRQPYTGPPENMRDLIVAAVRALLDGDWKLASQHILAIPAWALLPAPEVVKAMVGRKIQEEGLRTFLFQASQIYDGLGLAELVAMFEMEPPRVHAIASKMMINEEIHASWDSSSVTILFHRAEPSRLQQLALQLAEKTNQLVEANEKLMEIKLGAPRGDQKQLREKEQTWTDRAPERRPERREFREGGYPRYGDRRFPQRQGPVVQRFDPHTPRRPQFTRF